MKRWMRSVAASEISSDLSTFIDICSTYFNNIVSEEGFDNFKELKQSYDWDASDIREEIRSLAEENGWLMYDDGSYIVNDDTYEEVKYGDLKRAIFKKVN